MQSANGERLVKQLHRIQPSVSRHWGGDKNFSQR